MPFRESFDRIYKLGIRKACEAAGVRCERVDDQKFQGGILERVYNQIQAADIIIGDLTERNPNVYYEVGYAHAIHKRVILLTQKASGIPYDLRQYRHIVYGGGVAGLKWKLVEELKWLIRTPQPEADTWSAQSIVRRIIRILADVSKTVVGRQEMEPLLESILREVTEILDAEVCSIFLNDSRHPDVIQCVAGTGFAKYIVGIAKYKSGEGFTGGVFERAQTTIISSRDELKQLRRRREFQGKYDDRQWAAFGGKSQFRNGIASPLRIGEETIGVIKVENKKGGEFGAGDVSILEAISNGVLAMAIQNARLLARSI
jgi:hypothetical protein